MPNRSLVLVLSAIALIPVMAFGRTFQIVDPGRVIECSRLVFVGKVKSVKPSGISAPIHYVTWGQLSFPWLSVEVEVLEPFKGVEKGDIVRVMMLSIDRSGVVHGPILSPPVVLEPNPGDVFFLCLGRTPLTNTFAALSGPYNEFLSVFPLHRRDKTSSLSDNTARNTLKDDRFQLIWRLVDARGDLIPDSVAKLRNAYADEIRTPSKYDMVDLGSGENGWGSRLFKPGPYR